MFNPKSDQKKDSKSVLPEKEVETKDAETKEQTNPDVALYDAMAKHARKVFTEKNSEYGGAFRATGVLGSAVSFVKYSARVVKLVLKSPDHGESNVGALKEIFIDIVNYGIISMMMIVEKNWDGE